MVYYNEFEPYAAQWLQNLSDNGHIAKGYVDSRSILDVKPEELKNYEQCHFFAGIGIWSHALRLAGWPDDRPVWTGSCPCFPAGTLIITKRGFIPIEEVVEGDFVLTHKNRWRKVTCIGSETGELVSVKGQGHWGLVCTPDHPFLTEDGEWLPAKEMQDKKWRMILKTPDSARDGSPSDYNINSNVLTNLFAKEIEPDKREFPLWLFSMSNEYIENFLDGCFGCLDEISIASRSIAIGLRILLNHIGISATILYDGKHYKVIKNESKIENDEQHAFGLVRSVEQAGTGRVYNLSVEEDETYTADGIVVHNCQPFSTAGSKRGVNDERHLWPCWFELIKENKPPVIFGEQVAAAIGHSWLDLVFANLESIDYTVGAAVLTAAGFGAPHVRPRLFFVAHANGGRPQLHDERWQSEVGKIRYRFSAQADTIGHLRESNEAHGKRRVSDGNGGNNRRPQPTNGFWRSCEWFRCSDALWRPVEPGTFPLAHGNSSRVGRLRAYGNAIVPQVAAEMIMAYMAYEKEILGNS